MAIFTNYATLSYSGGTTTSNTVTGEIIETVSATKTAVLPDYTSGDSVTYVISLLYSGAVTISGLTVTDDLGGYTSGGTTVYPLDYIDGSVKYYVNGVLQPAPTVTAGPPLAISGISVPANGNAIIVYEASVTDFAPLATASTIVNTATVTGASLATDVTASETVTAENRAELTISKSVNPTVISESGQLNYVFVIENTGNTAATATDNAILTDVFDPILTNLAVTFNGATWTEGTNYTYNEATGEFTTVEGQITVPAATYTQNPDGSYTTIPGISTLTVSGII